MAPAKEEEGLEPREDAPMIQDSLLERIHHFTWAWFTLTMSTGGIALLLASQAHVFKGLMTIGTIIFIFDLVLFLALCITITIRFLSFPGSFKRSLQNPTEALFFPTAFLSVACIIASIHKYGVPSSGPWLLVVIRILYWIYIACSFLLAVFQYGYLFTATTLTIQSMTPAWALPILPITLAGTIASVISEPQSPTHSIPMIVGGLTFQGLGMLVSILIYAQYIGRLMQYGLPAANLRPGMFIAVGPGSFTAVAVIGLARSLPQTGTTGYFHNIAVAYEALNAIAVFMAIFIWGFSFWFFAVSLISCLACWGEMKFHLSWWGFVFPNIGFALATIEIGVSLESEAVTWVGSAMTILLVAMWCFVFPHNMRALFRKDIMLEGKDEDVWLEREMTERKVEDI